MFSHLLSISEYQQPLEALEEVKLFLFLCKKRVGFLNNYKYISEGVYSRDLTLIINSIHFLEICHDYRAFHLKMYSLIHRYFYLLRLFL